MRNENAPRVYAREFCSCPMGKCPRHPKNHDDGCDPCIADNLKKGKMPACFFRVVSEDVSDAKDFTIPGFVDFFHKHKDRYTERFSKRTAEEKTEKS